MKIKLSESDLHNIIEKAINKTLNELNSKTYFSAADKASKYGQKSRSLDFDAYGIETLNKELNTENGFNADRDGFLLQNFGGNFRNLVYKKNVDEMYVKNGPFKEYVSIEPNSNELRTTNRNHIKQILSYLNQINPQSKYNNKSMWIR